MDKKIMEWRGLNELEFFFTGKNRILEQARYPGELGRLLEGEGLSNGLLISDPVFIKNGLADQVVEASKGRITGVFSDLVPNPTVENVDTCSGLVRERGYEFLVCLGGGSSLDCGKAVGSLCKTQDSIREYMYGKKTFGPGHLPLIAIPTTAGTRAVK